MSTTSFSFQTEDGLKIYTRKWESEEKPRAIVQIAHGMAEHIERYAEFAESLVSKQVFVVGNDHRGHGRTASLNGSVGYFGDEHGFENAVNDMRTLTSLIKEDYPDVPIFIFGHSMGSFLSRRYIQLQGDNLSGVILCGTGGDPGFMGKVGKFLAGREVKKHGRKTQSPMLNKLIFGNYNKAFRPNRTDFDWLSRDKNEVDRYIKDPSCGEVFTAGFYYDLLEGLELINQPQNVKLTPKSLPIFLLSGSEDPVGNHTKGVLQTYNAYKRIGIEDLTIKFYDDARHELLNETNKKMVYQDVIEWIEKRL